MANPHSSNQLSFTSRYLDATPSSKKRGNVTRAFEQTARHQTPESTVLSALKHASFVTRIPELPLFVIFFKMRSRFLESMHIDITIELPSRHLKDVESFCFQYLRELFIGSVPSIHCFFLRSSYPVLESLEVKLQDGIGSSFTKDFIQKV
jgi:hypothetical protein